MKTYVLMKHIIMIFVCYCAELCNNLHWRMQDLPVVGGIAVCGLHVTEVNAEDVW